MNISPIKFNISFRGERDENQPLSPALREIFSDKSISKEKQRLLWELSEVPDFYEASKNLTKDEFVKLSDFISDQDTNILEMALKGDVRIVTKDEEAEEAKAAVEAGENEDEGQSFFKFKPLVKYNRNAENGVKKGFFEYIKEHPIFKIMKDVAASHSEDNIYPSFLNYSIEKDDKGQPVYSVQTPMAAQSNMFFNALTTGKVFNGNAVVIFKKDIKGKNDFNYRYNPVNPESVEEPYPVEPECIRALMEARGINPEIKDSVSALEKVPYFKNIISSTHPLVLAELAGMNSTSNGLLEKMLRGRVTIGIFEPKTKKEFQRPVIDIGQLLLDKKTGKIKNPDFLSMLMENTMAIEACILYNSFKETFPDKKINYIMLSKTERGIIQNVITTANENKAFLIPNEHPISSKIIKQLEQVPYKRIAINYNEK